MLKFPVRMHFLPATVLAATALALAAVIGVFAENIDPADDMSQYAWGENVGWINAEPSGNGGPGVQVSYKHITGYMWGENIGWINMSCKNNSTCGTTDYGVKNDGAGNLSGYAWGENVGWISFSCTNTSSCGTSNYGLTINPITGEWNGFAWGENIGWISFRDTTPVAYGVTSSDQDSVDQNVDNCKFDANDTQTNTDNPNPAFGTPYSDAFGDACDDDDDGDSCTDEREAGANPLLGGDRNPLVVWDFFDVPVPALTNLNQTGTRSKLINLSDVLAVVTYVGTSLGGPTNTNGADYDSDHNANGVIDGREYDRTPSSDPAKPWRSGPPSNLITLADALVALAQVGATCN